MRILSNAHTHSTWCDGANTLDEMARSALGEGFTDLGFSSHSPAPYDPGCPGVADMDAYVRAVRALAAAYEGRLNIACGIEQDYYGQVDRKPLDYVIGAVHSLRDETGGDWPVDASPDRARDCVERVFGGDGLRMARAFYDLTVQNVESCQPDIVAHFDLVAKFNGGGRLFDEGQAAYLDAALSALDRLLDVLAGYGGILEVNTRAMAAGYRDEPYPAGFLLAHAAGRGARVMLSSDCHRAGALADGFADALQRLEHAGFKSVAVLEKGRFVDVNF